MKETDIISSQEEAQCALCGSEGEYVYRDLSDRLFGHSTGWHLRKCNNVHCQLMWMDPMPTPEDIWKAYADYYTHSEQKKGFSYNEHLAKHYLSKTYGYGKANFLTKILGSLVYLNPLLKSEADFNVFYLKNRSNGKVLDFGCGNGWLLHNLKDRGWETYGVDFDEKAIEYCRSNGLNVSEPDLEQFEDNFFDAITINHVIEHVHDFDTLITQCYSKLKRGGELVIATPNTDNWLLGKYKSDWMQLDPPRHLHLFNLDNLGKVLSEKGFQIEKSTSSFRIDAWATIVSREISRSGYFNYADNSKTKMDVIVGLVHQLITSLWLPFNRKVGGELILKARKS